MPMNPQPGRGQSNPQTQHTAQTLPTRPHTNNGNPGTVYNTSPGYNGGQQPNLGRYTPQMFGLDGKPINGTDQQGGYSYNLPNAFGPFPMYNNFGNTNSFFPTMGGGNMSAHGNPNHGGYQNFNPQPRNPQGGSSYQDYVNQFQGRQLQPGQVGDMAMIPGRDMPLDENAWRQAQQQLTANPGGFGGSMDWGALIQQLRNTGGLGLGGMPEATLPGGTGPRGGSGTSSGWLDQFRNDLGIPSGNAPVGGDVTMNPGVSQMRELNGGKPGQPGPAKPTPPQPSQPSGPVHGRIGMGNAASQLDQMRNAMNGNFPMPGGAGAPPQWLLDKWASKFPTGG